MDIEKAREFIRNNHRAVVCTYRRDGRPQLSPVTVGVDDEGRVEVSATESRAKVRNLQRDPRASVCAFTDAFFGPWVQVDGRSEIVTMPDALEPLVEYYRRISGEHPDWDEYRSVMVQESRCLIKITIERAGPSSVA
jgi:PPOX class probable F420-dependent enzyme